MKRSALICLFALALLTADPAHSEAADDFFRGKQISLVIGYNPGGSYDAYGRINVSSAVITRHRDQPGITAALATPCGPCKACKSAIVHGKAS
jgi:hypothetical protein